MQKNKLAFVLGGIAASLMVSASAWAAPSLNYSAPPEPKKVRPAIPGRFGPEFTITFDGNSVTTEKKEQFFEHLRRHLKHNQPEGAKFTEGSGPNIRFHSPNGWWFDIGTDPGVLEIHMNPMTVEEIRRFKADIQDAIFVSAANVGLFPWDFLGGGHINFDTSIFGDSILLARNYVVDFWNHNELSMGILGYSTNNAVPFALFNAAEQAELAHVIARADAGEFLDNELGLQNFFTELNSIQARATNRLGGFQRGKNHSINLAHRGRIELRPVRPQANTEVWFNQVELIESRINNHLRYIEKPLPIKLRVPVTEPLIDDATKPDSHVFNPPVDAQLALRAFHQYVIESRLEWKDHREYIWPAWYRGGELQIFENSEEFKVRERLYQLKRRARAAMACKGLLTP